MTLLDGLGEPIEGARVSVIARRPASSDAPIAVGLNPVAGSSGQYAGEVALKATGSWLLVFTVERNGQPTLKTDASIDVADQ